MYGTRYVIRPTCGRVAKMASPSVARNLSYIPAPFYPRFAASSGGFGDVFRLLDESARAFDNFFPQSLCQQPSSQQQQVFAPRFDVREVDGAYQLRGELPGVDAKNLDVQFVDPKTLVISGRTERESSSGTPPAALQASEQVAQVENINATQQAVDNSDAASVHSSGSNFQKASVEDDYVDAGEEASSSAAARATAESTVNTTATEISAPAEQTQEQPQPEIQEPQHRYWVSERSVGSFSRTFNFPANVDQDAVTASLKNGILDIVVPKARVPEPRRISVS